MWFITYYLKISEIYDICIKLIDGNTLINLNKIYNLSNIIYIYEFVKYCDIIKNYRFKLLLLKTLLNNFIIFSKTNKYICIKMLGLYLDHYNMIEKNVAIYNTIFNNFYSMVGQHTGAYTHIYCNKCGLVHCDAKILLYMLNSTSQITLLWEQNIGILKNHKDIITKINNKCKMNQMILIKYVNAYAGKQIATLPIKELYSLIFDENITNDFFDMVDREYLYSEIINKHIIDNTNCEKLIDYYMKNGEHLMAFKYIEFIEKYDLVFKYYDDDALIKIFYDPKIIFFKNIMNYLFEYYKKIDSIYYDKYIYCIIDNNWCALFKNFMAFINDNILNNSNDIILSKLIIYYNYIGHDYSKLLELYINRKEFLNFKLFNDLVLKLDDDKLKLIYYNSCAEVKKILCDKYSFFDIDDININNINNISAKLLLKNNCIAVFQQIYNANKNICFHPNNKLLLNNNVKRYINKFNKIDVNTKHKCPICFDDAICISIDCTHNICLDCYPIVLYKFKKCPECNLPVYIDN